METFLKQVLEEFQVEQNEIVNNTIRKLMHNAKIHQLAKAINASKQEVLTLFGMYKEKEEFKDSVLVIANANANKPYDFNIDLSKFPHIHIKEIRNLNRIGLAFDVEQLRIHGVPQFAQTIDLQLVFVHTVEENPADDVKIISFVVNADPKDLWLNKPSNQSDLYAKPDSDKYVGEFLDKRIVVASQRGRSHAHEGTFRDDDFFVSKLPMDWAIIALADGAGSAKFARQGSKMATQDVVHDFQNEDTLQELNNLCFAYYGNSSTDDDILLSVKASIINILYKPVRNVHTRLSEFAKEEAIQLKDLHTTLIFALVKKFEFGYVVLTFGVGDCPINVVLPDLDEVHLLNRLDIGEFGGGTRFITMSEIFNQPEMPGRFSLNRFHDFSKLVLMTDGIYDAKFITENKLEDKAAWSTFLQDLNGHNEGGIEVDFTDYEHVDDQLLIWLDFWSKGNHDDRTLAIIY